MTSSADASSLGIVGMGSVGLSLAIAFAEAGVSVRGVDTDAAKVEAIDAGRSYVAGVPDNELASHVEAGRISASTDPAVLRDCEAILLCLPTPLDRHREPDLSYVIAGTQAVADNMAPGALVVLESSTYPGTTREVVQPILERDGRTVGRDFYLAFAPERIDQGNEQFGVRQTPRVVGGVTAECARRARTTYERIVGDVHVVSSPEIAEMSKLLENIFRAVNIALVNELAILCERMGIDVWETVEAASTKPFGYVPFWPGPGMGGHCIPIDPFYLAWRAKAYGLTIEFVELAGRINVAMPHYAAQRIQSALNHDRKPVKGSRVLLLGMGYKSNVGDIRESPSIRLLELLRGNGALVEYHDPHVPELPTYGLSSVDLSGARLRQTDCVVIATHHDSVDLRLVVDHAPRVVDLRNAVRRSLTGRESGDLPANVEVL